jgi:hypothetical protein
MIIDDQKAATDYYADSRNVRHGRAMDNIDFGILQSALRESW